MVRPVRRVAFPALAGLLLAGVLPALPWASPLDAQTIGQATVAEVIPGHQMAFRDGVREHMDWYMDAGGDLAVVTMEIVMGERTGQYVFWTPDHTYADFDDPSMQIPGAEESFYQRIAPHMQRSESFILMVDEELSILPEPGEMAPMYEVLTFEVAGPASERKWEMIMARIKEAFTTMNPTGRYTVFRGMQGAPLGTWIVSIPHENFASMAGGPGTMEDMFETVVSEMEARGLVDMMESAVTSATSEIFVVRPDLTMNMN